MSKLSVLVFGIIVLSLGVRAGQAAAQSQQDSVGNGRHSPIRFIPSFRSVQADGVTLVFRHSASGSVDVDLVALTWNSAGKIGFRVGVEWVGTGGAGGERNYYRDLNAFLRVTAAGERGRFDLLLGACSRGKERWGLASPNEFVAKFGAEGRLNLIDNYFGLFGKVSITEQLGLIGIGLFLGIDTWR